MNEPTKATGGGSNAAEEQEVRRLLERAGPRPAVPAADLAAIKAGFRAAWQEQIGRRPRRRPAVSWPTLALAASVVAAVGAGWWLWSLRPPAAAPPVARVETVAGAVTILRPAAGGSAAPVRLAVGETVPAGAVLETAGGERGVPARTALRLAAGLSLRLDEGSRLRLLSASAAELERGAVYVDSGLAPRPGGAIEIRTPMGVARELGTQFEVRLLGTGAMLVRVREGAVVVERGELSLAAASGTELTLHADGSVTRSPVARYGPPWDWVLRAAPGFEVEGRTVREFLDWVGRETGWEIRFADPTLEASAGAEIVHGTISDLGPDQAPAVVLPTAGLRHRLADGELVVSAAGGTSGR